MMVTIEFIKDFATKKKGDTAKFDSMVACRIIQQGFAKKSAVEVAPIEEPVKRVRRTKEQIEADKNKD